MGGLILGVNTCTCFLASWSSCFSR